MKKKYGGRVYSYLRFSDPKQATGTSAARQTKYATDWARKHGLELDTSLSMRDEGLSAYHQKHVKSGALGIFLRAVEQGLVPPGSVLIVENFDRLSRATPRTALAQVSTIVDAGITVVTAQDGKEWSAENMDDMDLLVSLVYMMRAHDESKNKSIRVRDAIRTKCINWQENNWRGIIHAGKCPAFLQLNRETQQYEFIPDRALAARTAIQLYMQGHGALRIAAVLDERGLVLSEENQKKAVKNLLLMEAVNGSRTFTINKDESYTLEGYYPALLSEAEYAELQVRRGQRRTNATRTEAPSLFTGAGITVCGYCGRPMNVQCTYYERRTPGPHGETHNQRRRFLCSSIYQGAVCKGKASGNIQPVERAIMDFCADEFNLAKLMRGDGREQGIAAQLAKKRQEAVKLDKQVDNVTDTITNTDDEPSRERFKTKLRELLAKLEEARSQVATLEYEMAQLGAMPTPEAAALWGSLKEGVHALDTDARLKVRQLFHDTFARMEVYQKGFRLENDGTIGLMLVPKRGSTWLLYVDKVSGDWRAEQHVDTAGEMPLARTAPAKRGAARARA